MINSRQLSDLRADVEANCRIFLWLCEAEGLKVLVTQTLRDDEYQASLYAKGRTAPGSIVTNSKVTTFHGAGLAFDICKNVKGQEYSDASFFTRCGAIAKRVGFSWGGDFKSFPDRPHIQWDAGGQYSGSMIRAGRLPGVMPTYERSGDMITIDDINSMDETTVLALAAKLQNVLGQQAQTGSVGDELQEAVAAGITDGSRPKAFCTRAQAAVMVKRAMKGAK